MIKIRQSQQTKSLSSEQFKESQLKKKASFNQRSQKFQNSYRRGSIEVEKQEQSDQQLRKEEVQDLVQCKNELDLHVHEIQSPHNYNKKQDWICHEFSPFQKSQYKQLIIDSKEAITSSNYNHLTSREKSIQIRIPDQKLYLQSNRLKINKRALQRDALIINLINKEKLTPSEKLAFLCQQSDQKRHKMTHKSNQSCCVKLIDKQFKFLGLPRYIKQKDNQFKYNRSSQSKLIRQNQIEKSSHNPILDRISNASTDYLSCQDKSQDFFKQHEIQKLPKSMINKFKQLRLNCNNEHDDIRASVVKFDHKHRFFTKQKSEQEQLMESLRNDFQFQFVYQI